MDSAVWRRILALVALVAVEALGGLRLSAATHTHPGYIFDAVDRHRLAARYIAYASDKLASSVGGCLRFQGNPLDDGTADPKTGEFTVQLVDAPLTYSMSYCLGGYVPRGLTGNDNHIDKVPVKYYGIRLVPKDGNLSVALKNLRSDAQGTVLSIASYDVDAFRSAVKTLPGPDRALIEALASIQLVQLPSREASVSELASYLRTFLDALNSDLAYLRSADPEQFDKAVAEMKEFRAYVGEKRLFAPD